MNDQTQTPIEAKKPHPATVHGIWTVEDMAKANQRVNGHWFDADTMKFFNSRLDWQTFHAESGTKILFVSSERNSGGFGGSRYKRYYSIRVFDVATSTVDTVGEFQAYNGLETARRNAKKIAATM